MDQDPAPDQPTTAAARQANTARGELWRQCLLRPARDAVAGSGVLFLVVIQHFEASNTAKGWLAGVHTGGMLLAPFVVAATAASGATLSKATAALLFVAAVGFAIMGLADSLTVFAVGMVIGAPMLFAIAPLITALWQQNIMPSMRGKLFARVGALSTVISVGAGFAFAAWLELVGVDAYRSIAMMLALLLVLAGRWSLRIPSSTIQQRSRFPLASLALLWQHPLFGYLCLTWFFMGFANLSSIPLRAEYIASGDYGLRYSPGLVLLITLIIPQVVAIGAGFFWGWLFDRSPFIAVRIGINVVFALSILVFFHPNLWVQVAGSVLMGIGMGGGNVAWNMWVTKYAPPHRTAEYMSVHTFLTGFRGLLGPVIAFQAIRTMPIQHVALFDAGLAVLAALMLIPFVRGDRTHLHEHEL